jgi:hypothetical protein
MIKIYLNISPHSHRLVTKSTVIMTDIRDMETYMTDSCMAVNPLSLMDREDEIEEIVNRGARM